MKKAKLQIVEFDEKARKDFITGFHKRKVEQKRIKVQKSKAKTKEAKRESRKAKRQKLSTVLPDLERIEGMNIVEQPKQKIVLETTERITTVTIEELNMDEL
jgi:hypothetical protein